MKQLIDFLEKLEDKKIYYVQASKQLTQIIVNIDALILKGTEE